MQQCIPHHISIGTNFTFASSHRMSCCSCLLRNAKDNDNLKDRTHDATLHATLRAMGWTHSAIVAWNVAEVELASTPATLRAILHAMLHRVSGPLVLIRWPSRSHQMAPGRSVRKHELKGSLTYPDSTDFVRVRGEGQHNTAKYIVQTSVKLPH